MIERLMIFAGGATFALVIASIATGESTLTLIHTGLEGAPEYLLSAVGKLYFWA